MNKLHVTPLARQDLKDIKEYIADTLANEASAVRLISKITKRIRELLISENEVIL